MSRLRATRRIQDITRQLSTRSLLRDGEKQVTVWWDSSCPLCTKEIQYLRKKDVSGKIDFRALGETSPEEITIGTKAIPKNQLLGRFHAREKGGEVVNGARAFGVLWRTIPSGPLRLLGEFMRNPIGLFVMEKFYSLFLLIRPTIQRIARRIL